MKRIIIRKYDEKNGIWNVAYYRKFDNSVHLQEFETPLFTGNTMKAQVGNKSKTMERWFGKTFIQELANVMGGIDGKV